MPSIIAKDVRVGTKLASAEDGSTIVVTKVLAGDHSPFGKTGAGKFWHLNPLTIFYKKGCQVCAPSDILELHN